MIYQGQNYPLVVGLPEDVSTASEIHVEIHNSLRQIKHWDEDEITIYSNVLLCPLTQEDTLGFPTGRAFASAKWLRADGTIGMIKNVPISVGASSDHDILGDDEPITETDIVYTGELAEAQGILTPESIRSAIVIRAGTVDETTATTLINAWLTSHASQIKGETGATGADGKSAYQLAVDGGYSGTQSQWLASLKGADGQAGRDGSDASVTASNIASALGYTPADAQGLANTDEHIAEDIEPDIATLKYDLYYKIDSPDETPSVGNILRVASVDDAGEYICEWADANENKITVTFTAGEYDEDGGYYNVESDISMLEILQYYQEGKLIDAVLLSKYTNDSSVPNTRIQLKLISANPIYVIFGTSDGSYGVRVLMPSAWRSPNKLTYYNVPTASDYRQIKEDLTTKLTEPTSGLAVGKYFKVASIDSDGHAVLEACDLPKASESAIGAIKVNSYYGTQVNNDGLLYGVSRTKDRYSALQNDGFVTKGTLENNKQTIVDSVLCSTATTEALTTTQQAAARARLGIEKEWVLKGTISGNADDRGNIDTGVTVDLSGCTEVALIGKTTGTGNTFFSYNDGLYFAGYTVRNGVRSSCTIARDSGVPNGYYFPFARYQDDAGVNSFSMATTYLYSSNNGMKIANMNKFGFINASLVTSCELKIYAR